MQWLVRDARITLAHGSGGKAMHDLIEDVFVTTFDDAALHPLEDQARLPLAELVARGDRPAFTTDSYVENVGNLVCPALFDLGEGAKVVMLSVTEGDDKPLKYPHIFRAAGIVIITKSDLLPHVDFSIERCLGNMRAVDQELRPFRHHRRGGRCVVRLAESRGNRRRAGIGIADLRTFPARASNPIVIVPGFA